VGGIGDQRHRVGEEAEPGFGKDEGGVDPRRNGEGAVVGGRTMVVAVSAAAVAVPAVAMVVVVVPAKAMIVVVAMIVPAARAGPGFSIAITMRLVVRVGGEGSDRAVRRGRGWGGILRDVAVAESTVAMVVWCMRVTVLVRAGSRGWGRWRHGREYRTPSRRKSW
jgi:hypothetical protein